MTTRIFLVGAGVIAQHHAAAVKRLPGAESIPIYVTDPNPAALERFRAAVPLAQTCPTLDALLSVSPQPEDIVIVATPPAFHYAATVQSFRSGRHVLCEKPMALNQGEVEGMLAAAKAAGRTLGCCSCRFLGIPTTTAARDMVRSGHLGPLYHATFVHRERRQRPGIEYQPGSPFYLEKAKNGGGTLMNMGPYDFTTLNYVLAPRRVDVLHAWQANPTTALHLPPGVVFDVEQQLGATLLFHLENGDRLTLTYERSSCTHGAEQAVYEIEGLRGALRWNWLESAPSGVLRVSFDRDGAVEDEDRQLSNDLDIPLHERPLVYFYRRLHGIEAPIAVDEQAVFNFSIVLAMYRAAESGQPQSVVWE